MNFVTITRNTFEGPKQEIIEVGSDCFIGHCGSGTTVFGENGKVTKISDRYIFCTSESGSVVKYNIENRCVCGKWKKDFYFINFNTTIEYGIKVIKSRPSVWNSSKARLEFK